VNSRRALADEVFILRFWREQETLERQFRWRVQVRTLATRDRYTAESVEAAFAVICARLSAASDDYG
jgi:hypothetical protein